MKTQQLCFLHVNYYWQYAHKIKSINWYQFFQYDEFSKYKVRNSISNNREYETTKDQ